jgi:pyrroloquinoline-quinone synthase
VNRAGDETPARDERAAFAARLRLIGEERYHHRHPFNLRMHEGTLTREEIQTWVRNRYYYQTRIPKKDSTILAKDGTTTDFRREWIGRIHDHDGARAGEGGLALWLDLAVATGLDREEVESLRFVLPGVREACDAYVAFVSSHDLLECVAASLTEMFAGDIMKVRIAAFEQHYPWVRREGLRYFQTRTEQAPRDAAFGLSWVLDHARTPEDRDRCARALERKCEILWSLLDAVEAAHRRLGPVAHAQVREDPLEDRTLVVMPERAVALNASARELLELCDGQRTAETLALTIARRHPDAPDAYADAHAFLAHMQRAGVLSSGG